MNGKCESKPGLWIWDHPSGPLTGHDPPSLEEEVWYLEIVVAEASLAAEQAQSGKERGKYQGYLKRAIERYNEAAAQLGALEREVEYARQ